MTGATYKHELEVAVALAREAGAVILSLYKQPLEIEHKSDGAHFEPVTEADRAANDMIVSRLRREFPADGILAEESLDTEERLSKSRVWMIDPLDGTSGFIERNGDFAVQIGLAEKGKAVVGVVYQPVPDLLYHAVRGGGAWIERRRGAPQRARVSDQQDLDSMSLAASRSHRSPRMDQVVKALGVRREVRRGSVGIKVGLIIERRCDLYVHLSPRTRQWDTCGPQIILREAGGEFSDLFGAPVSYNARDLQHRNGIVASNSVAHQKIINTLAPLMVEFGRRPV